MESKEVEYTKLIALAGDARSSYIEAIHLAKKGEFEKAKEKIEAGKKAFIEGHKVHFELMSNSDNAYNYQENLLLIHAEDQLASAENFGIIAEEFIDFIKK
jgi:cellobiose PTS system EIIA component